MTKAAHAGDGAIMMEWTGQDGGGVAVTVPTRDALVADLRTRMRDRIGYTVATINLDHVVKLHRDTQFRAAYVQHSHVTADGNPIVWLSRLSGQADVELVAGSDISGPVLDLAAEEGVPVALFGSTDAALSAAAHALRERAPSLKIVAQISPPFGFDPDGPEADRCIAQLAASGARLVMLALGAPKQERFAVRAAERMPEAGFLSIGASLDFFAGSQKRAPKWVRAMAMEWAWRMLGNPRRLAGRYMSCFAILPGLTLRALKARRRGPGHDNPDAGPGHA